MTGDRRRRGRVRLEWGGSRNPKALVPDFIGAEPEDIRREGLEVRWVRPTLGGPDPREWQAGDWIDLRRTGK